MMTLWELGERDLGKQQTRKKRVLFCRANGLTEKTMDACKQLFRKSSD